MGAGGGYIYTVGTIAPTTGGYGQVGYLGSPNHHYYAMVADFFYSRGGGSGSEVGQVGTSSHRFVSGYMRTVYTLGGGQYDEYDDLALVKQWGVKEPTIPADYDASKLKPQSNDPFSMLRAQEGDEYFNLNNLVSFSLGCSKALAYKQDETSEKILALYNGIETNEAEIAKLRQEITDLKKQLAR